MKTVNRAKSTEIRSPREKLTELKELFKDRLITEEEFGAKKAQILKDL